MASAGGVGGGAPGLFDVPPPPPSPPLGSSGDPRSGPDSAPPLLARPSGPSGPAGAKKPPRPSFSLLRGASLLALPLPPGQTAPIAEEDDDGDE